MLFYFSRGFNTSCFLKRSRPTFPFSFSLGRACRHLDRMGLLLRLAGRAVPDTVVFVLNSLPLRSPWLSHSVQQTLRLSRRLHCCSGPVSRLQRRSIRTSRRSFRKTSVCHNDHSRSLGLWSWSSGSCSKLYTPVTRRASGKIQATQSGQGQIQSQEVSAERLRIRRSTIAESVIRSFPTLRLRLWQSTVPRRKTGNTRGCSS